MTLRSVLLFSGLLLLSSQTLAQTSSSEAGIYIGGAAGPQFFDGGADAFGYNTGFGLGGQLGYRFGQFRAEAELNYASSEFRDVDNDVFEFDIIRGAVSLLYDVPTSLDAVSFYLGGGFGAAYIDTQGKGSGFEDEDEGLTLHSELGLTIDVSPTFAIVPQYRFEWFETGIAGFDDYFHAHAFRMGARMGF